MIRVAISQKRKGRGAHPYPRGLGFEAMLRLVLPLEITLRGQAAGRLEFWHMTRADIWQSNGIPGPTQHQWSSKSMPCRQCMAKMPSTPQPYHTASALSEEGHCPGQDPENHRVPRGSNHLYNGGSSICEVLTTTGCHRTRRSYDRHNPHPQGAR